MPLTQDQFLQQRQAIRGANNPRRMNVPLWEELIRSGETAYAAALRYGCASKGPAGWCFDRFGMSRTRLTDGRIVCIAGEHEDHYDPDFFIYNDVVVIRLGGEIEIYGYSPDVFPPTDFHTATLVGDAIYIIGGLGYKGERGGASTPIYRLDIRSMRISPVTAGNDGPGWIFGHRAELASDGRSIRIGGGEVITRDNAGKESSQKCASIFIFETAEERWSAGDGVVPTLPETGQCVALPGWAPPMNQKKAQELRDAIARAVAPDHPLFCGDFWPMAEQQASLDHVAIQMLDGSGRWAICDGPAYTGRETAPSLQVNFYSTSKDSLDAASQVGEK